MRSLSWKLLTLALTIPLLGGCLRGSTSGEAQQPAQQEKQSEAAKKTLSPESLPEVVARVNGQEIKRSDLLMRLRMNEARATQSGQPLPEDRSQLLRAALDELINNLLLFQEGKARGRMATDAEVEKHMADIKKRFPNDQVFEAALKSQGITLDQLKHELLLNLTIVKFIEADIKPKVEVSDADIKAFYDVNQDKLKEPEQVRASHILVKASAENKQEARKRAEELLKQIRDGKDFAELAKANSDDTATRGQGGDLGFLARGATVSEFEQAAFALKEGEVSSIVETKFGFHIIKVTERKPARTIPLEEVKDQIKEFLSQSGVADKIRATIEELKAKGKIEILL